MTLAETYREMTILAAREAIGENPGRAGSIIRDLIETMLQTADGLRQLAAEMEEWTPEPILEFPSPSRVRHQALDHIAWEALKALRKEYREEAKRICDRCADLAAPSLDEAITDVMAKYMPGPAILLAEEVATSEHRRMALEALEELPQEELDALLQAAVSHAAQDDEDDEDDERETDR